MKSVFVLLSLLLVPSIAFANGGPIEVSAIYGIGNITMMKYHDITLEEENLWVGIDGDYANVAVEYQLKNRGPDVKLTYGFPLDLIINMEQDEDEPSQGPEREFRIQDDSGDLKVNVQTEESTKTIKGNDDDRLLEFKIERKWFVTELTFKAGEIKHLKVKYRLKNRLDDWVYSKSFQPTFSDRKFTYILQPSKNWGNGKVKKFTATIDLTKLLEMNGVVKDVKPTGYRLKGGILEWRMDNLDLGKAQDIQLVYDNTASKMSKYISEYRLPLKYIIKNSASSVLPTDSINKYSYGPDNLFDNDYNTAWVEGAKGNGVGEWVEVDLDRVSISGIGIINGYTKKKRLYYANNRIKKLRLDVEWENWSGRKGGLETSKLTLKEKNFNELNRKAEAPFISWLADYGDGYNRAKKIRLTILDVFPGTKYKDTPITELFILGEKFED